MRITSKGQVTIPQHIREQFGMLPDTDVEFEVKDGNVVVRPSGAEPHDWAWEAVQRLKGSGHGRMTTDEIMELTRGLE